jgi:hypothetical protein
MAFESQAFRFIGKHRLKSQEDVYVWETHGEITLEEAKDLCAAQQPLTQALGYSMLFIDARQGLSVGVEVRRYFAEFSRELDQPSCTVFLGASSLVRTMSILLSNAIRLLTRPRPGGLHFVKSEAEAWQIFAEQRPALKAAAKTRG